MQELIFIIILAVFIGGMFWSDRDSRRMRLGERLIYFRQFTFNAKEVAQALTLIANASMSAREAVEHFKSNIESEEK